MIVAGSSWILLVVAMMSLCGRGSSRVLRRAFRADQLALSRFSISTTLSVPTELCASQSLSSLIDRLWI